jgi:hypothetical protein
MDPLAKAFAAALVVTAPGTFAFMVNWLRSHRDTRHRSRKWKKAHRKRWKR